MNANIIKLYDLDVVPTTIVMREIPVNPDVQNIIMHSLDAVTTTIVLRAIGAFDAASYFFGVLKYYNGATWERALLKVYTGSFGAKPLKRFDGADWLEVDATG
jgi:hypothetical protein